CVKTERTFARAVWPWCNCNSFKPPPPVPTQSLSEPSCTMAVTKFAESPLLVVKSRSAPLRKSFNPPEYVPSQIPSSEASHRATIGSRVPRRPTGNTAISFFSLRNRPPPHVPIQTEPLRAASKDQIHSLSSRSLAVQGFKRPFWRTFSPPQFEPI